MPGISGRVLPILLLLGGGTCAFSPPQPHPMIVIRSEIPPDLDIPLDLESDRDAESALLQGPAGILLQSAPSLSDGLSKERSYCTALPPATAAGSRQLEPTTKRESPFRLTELEGGRIQLSEEDLPVFVYNFGEQLSGDAPADRRRSSYLHPVFDLRGNSLTDDFPVDHYHHRGLSWMWPRVTIAGRQYDLWHIRGLLNQFEDWTDREVGPVCATLGIHNSWRLADRKVVDEWVRIRAYRSGERGRAVDVTLTWAALEPVELLGQVDSGYGGFCFRLAPRRQPVISSEKGHEAEDSDLQPHPWADQTGRFGDDDRLSGVAIFQHPLNPGFPAGWCLRYYGFLGVSWPGLKPFRLEPGRPLTLRYRLWIHNGDVHSGRVAEAFDHFTTPPAELQ